MSRPWVTPALGLAVAAALALAAHVRTGDPPPAAKVPVADVEPWMLEALPGIGPKTAAERSAALRVEGLASLPPHLRETAAAVVTDYR